MLTGDLPRSFFDEPGNAVARVNLKKLQAIMMHYGDSLTIKNNRYMILHTKLCPGVFEVTLKMKMAASRGFPDFNIKR